MTITTSHMFERSATQDSAADLTIQMSAVDFAFQPIISTSSLQVHGFEALARLPGGMGPICPLLDRAAEIGALCETDLMLLKTAVRKFAQFPAAGATRLFCNMDNRSYAASLPSSGQISDFLKRYDLTPGNLSLEISERGSPRSAPDFLEIVEMLSGMGMKIALDDFGVGVSSLHMLMVTQPDYVKIDRAFIHGIGGDNRQQAIVSKLCGLAHALGFMTVAEGVETEKDFRMARDLGCDLAQGYYIARPTVRIEELSMSYGRALGGLETPGMNPRVAQLLTPVEPLNAEAPLLKAVEMFKAQPGLRLVPVVDDEKMVLGAVLEENVRSFMFSEFGPALLHNKGVAPRVKSQMSRFPLGKAHGTLETIVDSYVAAETSCGLILAHDGRYAGYLSNHALLRLASERDLSKAREQNPLTHLPGNHSIAHHIEDVLAASGPRTLIFFDFDNFKAFNDCYGFAAGDRALVMFADLLRGLESTMDAFAGHVGGDVFFASLGHDEETSNTVIGRLTAKFAHDAESLYSPADRLAGGIRTVDRFGAERFFPLLCASASMLHLPAERSHLTVEMVNERLTAGKKNAKASPSGLATVRLPEKAADPVYAVAPTRHGH